MKKLKSLPLYMRILIGMILGVVGGIVATQLNGGQFVSDYIKPFGDIFMRGLKLIAVPLILVSLIRGVGNLGDVSTLKGLGIRTILIYVGTTLIAIFIGLGFGSLVSPGSVVSAESVARLQQNYDTSVIEAGEQGVQTLTNVSPLQPLVEIFPDNMFGAMSSNDNMLQVIAIAVLLGVSILLIGRKRSEPFMQVLNSLDAIILKIVDIAMIYAPIGVFALMCSMVTDSAGDISLLGALGLYGITVVAALFTLILVVYPLMIRFFGGIKVRHFLKSMAPVQLLAFTTSSSAATLPLNMETVREKLGVSEQTSSFVLPVGVTINMDGTSCYQIISALFIAQVMGISLGWQEIAILVGTTTISSIGTPGIPGGSIVILVMVLESIGIPAAGLALILGMDRPLDMLRTVVNVTGDATVATIVDRSVSKKIKQ